MNSERISSSADSAQVTEMRDYHSLSSLPVNGLTLAGSGRRSRLEAIRTTAADTADRNLPVLERISMATVHHRMSFGIDATHAA